MRVSDFCLVAAALAGLSGMGLGLWMGLVHDFALAPVHAHINLLGWVTLALYGLYHRGDARADDRLAWVQAGAGALGFAALTLAMAAMLGAGLSAFLPVAIAGAALSIAGMALFLAIVIRDARVGRASAFRAVRPA